MSRTSDIDIALAAAAAGVSVVRERYRGDLVRHAKNGLDFATDVDIAAELAILDVLKASRPGDRLVGEETGDTGDAVGGDRSSSRRWLVDPLCGTLNFAARTPLVAVNVALVDDTRALAAVSADPIADETFWSDGHDTFLRREAVDSAARPSALSRLVDINCDGPSDRPFVGPQLLGDPAFRADFGPRVLSTTLAIAWVADGRHAGYVSDGSFTDNVHFAAGIALCRSAGCVVSDLGGDPLHTGRGLVVAADSATHERLIAIVRPHLRAVLQ